MKGIIFSLVEDAIVSDHGEATWDRLLTDTGLSGVYTALGNYPTDELVALVDAGSKTLDLPPDELLRTIGPHAVRGLVARYPQFVAPHDSVRPFLLTLNDVIHAEVRKLHPDARPPDFWFEDDDPDLLVVHYQSERRLCALAVGMIEGAADHFGQVAEVGHVQCLHDGADHCVLHVTFAPDPTRTG